MVAIMAAVAPIEAYAQAAAHEPSPSEIRAAAEAFDRGREAYKAESYQEAAEQFERADANAPSATALELALRSRDKANNADRAATLAALALERYPDEQSLIQLANDVLGKVKAGLYELKTRCDDPCELIADSKLIHGAPATERTIYLPPGPHTLVAGFGENRTVSKSVDAQQGQTATAIFEAPEPVANAAPSTAAPSSGTASPTQDTGTKPSHGGWSPIVFWTGVGLTAVAGGVTVWSGLDTINNPGADWVKEHCADTDCPEYKDGVQKQTRTNILIGVTGVLGAATILVGALATDWSGGSAEAGEVQPRRRQAFEKVQVLPWVSEQGAGLGAQGRF
jgi:hypothetical protein